MNSQQSWKKTRTSTNGWWIVGDDGFVKAWYEFEHEADRFLLSLTPTIPASVIGGIVASASGNSPGGPALPPPYSQNTIVLGPNGSYTHGTPPYTWTYTNNHPYDVLLDLNTGVMTPFPQQPGYYPPPPPAPRVTATEARMRLEPADWYGSGCRHCGTELEHKVFNTFEYDYCPKCRVEV